MVMTWHLLHVLNMNIHFQSTRYDQYVDMLVSWFDNSFLKLNAQKIEEMCFGHGRVKDAYHPLSQLLMIKGQPMQTVSTVKPYLLSQCRPCIQKGTTMSVFAPEIKEF